MNKCAIDYQPNMFVPSYQKATLPLFNQQMPLSPYIPQINHIPNIFCFHNCSVWTLALKSIYNKKIHPQGPFYGKITNTPNPINISLMQNQHHSCYL